MKRVLIQRKETCRVFHPLFLSSSRKVSDHWKWLYRRKKLAFFWKKNSLLSEFGLLSWQIQFLFQSQEQCSNVFYCSGRKYTCIIGVLTIPSHQASLLVSMHWVSLHCLAGRLLLLFVALQAHISPFIAEVKILKLSFDCKPFPMH